MKKIISAVASLFVATCAFAQTEFSSEGIYYKVSPNQQDVMVVACPKDETYEGAVVVPAKVTYEGTTYNVTHIGFAAFKKSAITSISLPEGLIEIGQAAFRECQNLKSVTIPSSVVNISGEAFIFCFSLNKVVFKGKKRPTIGDYAFGKTQVKMKGISTGIPANMAVPNKDERMKVNRNRGYVIY